MESQVKRRLTEQPKEVGTLKEKSKHRKKIKQETMSQLQHRLRRETGAKQQETAYRIHELRERDATRTKKEAKADFLASLKSWEKHSSTAGAKRRYESAKAEQQEIRAALYKNRKKKRATTK